MEDFLQLILSSWAEELMIYTTFTSRLVPVAFMNITFEKPVWENSLAKSKSC
jgi:hypothetical protein